MIEVLFWLLVWWGWREGEFSGETAWCFIIVWCLTLFCVWRLHASPFWLAGITLILDAILILKIFKHDPKVPHPHFLHWW